MLGPGLSVERFGSPLQWEIAAERFGTEKLRIRMTLHVSDAEQKS